MANSIHSRRQTCRESRDCRPPIVSKAGGVSSAKKPSGPHEAGVASSHRLPSRRIPRSQRRRRLHLVGRRQYHARSFLDSVSGIHGLLRRVLGRGIHSYVFILPADEFTFLMQPLFAPKTLPEPCSRVCDSWGSPSRPRHGT